MSRPGPGTPSVPGRAQLAAFAAAVWRRVPPAWRWRFLHASQQRFLVGVLGVIANSDGEVLLLEHRFRTPYPWGLPGGFVDVGEDLLEALSRELHEELALEVDIDPTPLDVELNPRTRHLSVVFAARPRDPTAPWRTDTTEVLSGGYFAPGTLPLGMYPRHAAILRAYWSDRSDIASRSS